MKLISNQGEVITFSISLYILANSKKRFIALTFDRKQDTLFDCLDDAFYHIGGGLEKIRCDNMKTVVDYSRIQFSKAQLNERLHVYNHEFYDSVDVIYLVNEFCEEIHSEISQAT